MRWRRSLTERARRRQQLRPADGDRLTHLSLVGLLNWSKTRGLARGSWLPPSSCGDLRSRTTQNQRASTESHVGSVGTYQHPLSLRLYIPAPSAGIGVTSRGRDELTASSNWPSCCGENVETTRVYTPAAWNGVRRLFKHQSLRSSVDLRDTCLALHPSLPYAYFELPATTSRSSNLRKRGPRTVVRVSPLAQKGTLSEQPTYQPSPPCA